MTDRPPHLNDDRDPATPGAGLTGPGEYAPAGELQGQASSFTADDVANAFDVAIHRVHDAMQGELGLGADARVESRQAQVLAEVLLGDQPLDRRQAALMQLGAYTPRADAERGIGEASPAEVRARNRADRTDAGADDGEPGGA
jgi:hypothetical protein